MARVKEPYTIKRRKEDKKPINTLDKFQKAFFGRNPEYGRTS